MKTVDKNEIKKELYRTKVDASLSRYEEGCLYYDVEVNGGLYQFPISVIATSTVQVEFATIEGPVSKDVEAMKLAEDLGSSHFTPVMPARLLNRWIEKAIDKDKFMLLTELSME